MKPTKEQIDEAVEYYTGEIDLGLEDDHRPAFDWKDVKAGMCFKTKSGMTIYAVGNDFKDEEFVLAAICNLPRLTDIDLFVKKQLTRYPEGDIKGGE